MSCCFFLFLVLLSFLLYTLASESFTWLSFSFVYLPILCVVLSTLCIYCHPLRPLGMAWVDVLNCDIWISSPTHTIHPQHEQWVNTPAQHNWRKVATIMGTWHSTKRYRFRNTHQFISMSFLPPDFLHRFHTHAYYKIYRTYSVYFQFFFLPLNKQMFHNLPGK